MHLHLPLPPPCLQSHRIKEKMTRALLAAGLLLLAITVAVCRAAPQDIANETNVQAWTCNNSTGQKWQLMNDSTIRLTAQNSACVDIVQYGTSDGSNIWLMACHTDDKVPSHQNQEWTYNSNGTITSVISGKCIESAAETAGSNVQLNSCTGADNQRWMYDNTTGEIKGLKSGLCIDVGSTASCQEQPWSGYPYCNPQLDPLTRAKDLVGRMEVAEMVTLMVSDQGGLPRLGVPPFGHTECTHGTLNDRKEFFTTLFPQAMTFARSFDRDLVYMIARAISDEVRGKHNDANKAGKYNHPYGLICWAPVVNICRDPRWGRCQEGYGEDPYLQAELATQYITALQNLNSSKYVEALATCKHFDVHAGPENIPESRFQFDAQVSYRDWIETFQPAFKACAEAGAISYMCSYNAINGVPACANRELLTDILRDTWKFDGFVVSDCGAIGNVYHRHNFARSDTEAAEFCVKAGCDWNCGREYNNLLASTQGGRMSEEELSVSVTRLMKAFIMLGALDPPEMVPYSNLTLSVVDDHVKLNNQAAMESIVLLENQNGILPMDLSKYKSVAIIGPCADDPVCSEGDYNPGPKYMVTVKAAFTNKTKLTVNYSPGCKDVGCTDNSGFADAVKAASSSDFVVYVGGISHRMEGEGHDRSNITIPGYQTDLILQLKKTNKPVIVVVTHGAPVPSPAYSEVDAVISAGYTGQEAGNAVLSVLTGEFNPAGRLVVTWYTGNEQLPPMVSYSMVNRTYRYMVNKPQYHFGYGLSYTTFNYSSLTIQPTSITPCQMVQVSVTVTNTGKVTGSEVVQFYLTIKNATVPAPGVKLVNFERESDMKAGEARTVKVAISPSQMTVVREGDYAEVIEPGQYVVYAGGSQPGDDKAPANVLSGSFQVGGDETPLSKCT